MASFSQFSADAQWFGSPRWGTVQKENPTEDPKADFYRKVIEQLLSALGKDVNDIAVILGSERKSSQEMLYQLQSKNVLSGDQISRLQGLYARHGRLDKSVPPRTQNSGVPLGSPQIPPKLVHSTSVATSMYRNARQDEPLYGVNLSENQNRQYIASPPRTTYYGSPMFIQSNPALHQTVDYVEEKLRRLQPMLTETAFKLLKSCKSLVNGRFLDSVESGCRSTGQSAGLDVLKSNASEGAQEAIPLLEQLMSLRSIQENQQNLNAFVSNLQVNQQNAANENSSLKSKLHEVLMQHQNSSLIARREVEDLKQHIDKLYISIRQASQGQLRMYASEGDKELPFELYKISDDIGTFGDFARERSRLEVEIHEQVLQNDKLLKSWKDRVSQMEAKERQLASNFDTKLREIENSASKVQENSLRVQQHYETLQRRVNELESQCNITSSNLTQAQLKIVDYEKELRQSRELANSYVQQIDSLTASSLNQLQIINELRVSGLAAQEKSLEISETANKNSKAIELLLKANNEIDEKNRLLKDQCTLLEKELEEVRKKSKRIEVQESLQVGQSSGVQGQQDQTWVKEKTALTDKIIELEKELSKGRHTSPEFESSKSFLSRKIEVLEDENTRLREEIESLMHDNEIMAKAIEDVEEGISKGDILIKRETHTSQWDAAQEAQSSGRYPKSQGSGRYQRSDGQEEGGYEAVEEGTEHFEGSQATLELSELLRAASEELNNIKKKYNDLKIAADEKEAIVSELHLKLELMAQENVRLKKVDQQEPNPAMQLADSKTNEDLVKENEELVEILKKAADEIKLLRSKYAEIVTQLHEKIQEGTQMENDDFAEGDLQQSSRPSRFEDLKESNKNLWRSLEQHQNDKNDFEHRIKKYEAWCTKNGIGNPPPSTARSRVNQQLQASDPVSARSSQDELSMEQLIELLLTTLQLGENVREIAANEELQERDRLDAIISMVDNFELFGENGRIDWKSVRASRAEQDKNLQAENEYLKQELQVAIKKLEAGDDKNEDFNEEDLQSRLIEVVQENEQMQLELNRLSEEMDLKDLSLKDFKKAMTAIVSDKRDSGGELSRLVSDNDRLRQNLVQLQRVFQEREAELEQQIDQLTNERHFGHE